VTIVAVPKDGSAFSVVSRPPIALWISGVVTSSAVTTIVAGW
jgi:hypothetical protein